MDRLKSIRISGYKSFQDAQIEFGDITVLLGANGAGKSNLVSFFSMLNFLGTGALQDYIGRKGGANSLLHFGSRMTSQIEASVEFGENDSSTHYRITLSDAAPDTLIFTDECVTFQAQGYLQPQEVLLGAGHKESLLKATAQSGDKTCQVLLSMMSGCKSYQFHDTSPSANIRKSAYTEDSRYLRSDAGNLAAFLHRMQTDDADCYSRIIDAIRLVYPSFGDFSLEPSLQNKNSILLNWRERGHSDYLLGPHQLSDGTLRFMALAALFLQPSLTIPKVIVLDEPELGLHPYAISVFAGLVKSVGTTGQVILATQSTRLVDEFDAEQIAVLELGESGSQCKRLDSGKLSEWLTDYSLGELWEKNIFGGRP